MAPAASHEDSGGEGGRPVGDAPFMASTAARRDNHDGAQERQGGIMEERLEQRSKERTEGNLTLEGNVHAQPRRGLADEFRSAGFPRETAMIPFETFEEFRAATWSGSVDAMKGATS